MTLIVAVNLAGLATDLNPPPVSNAVASAATHRQESKSTPALSESSSIPFPS